MDACIILVPVGKKDIIKIWIVYNQEEHEFYNSATAQYVRCLSQQKRYAEEYHKNKSDKNSELQLQLLYNIL